MLSALVGMVASVYISFGVKFENNLGIVSLYFFPDILSLPSPSDTSIVLCVWVCVCVTYSN